jgi:hypothetical protein
VIGLLKVSCYSAAWESYHFSLGEPIRSLALSLSSVFVGLIISFIYMWPFALLILVILPFLVRYWSVYGIAKPSLGIATLTPLAL